MPAQELQAITFLTLTGVSSLVLPHLANFHSQQQQALYSYSTPNSLATILLTLHSQAQIIRPFLTTALSLAPTYL